MCIRDRLDTTLCMRVLLDPEKDAARPLDLLGNTEPVSYTHLDVYKRQEQAPAQMDE